MSKINSTYSSGYYIAPDVDFRKLEELQRQEKRGKRGQQDDGGDDNVKRQTFAIPFDVICDHCHRRIARGSHVYANRRATDKRYLESIRIWELEILCRFCKGKYYLLTDPETPKDTGGYICDRGCKRVEGDYYALNKQNQAAREAWEKAKAEAELNPLAALEKENEAARALEERNRQIEEAVEGRAGHDDRELLTMLRSRTRRTEARATAAGGEEDADDDANVSGEGETSAEAPSASLPLPNVLARDGDGDGDDGDDGDDEDVDAQAFRIFNQDMERRWRTLERQQRAQQRQQEQQRSTALEATLPADGDELRRVLERYGGERRTTVAAATEAAMAPPGAPAPPLTSDTASSAPPTATPPPIAAPAPLTSSGAAKRNKFFVEDDDEDDDLNDLRADAPGLSRLLRSLPPGPSTAPARTAVGALSTPTGAVSAAVRPLSRLLSHTPITTTTAGAASPPLLHTRQPGISSLLRRLDDDDDDDT